MTSYSKPTPELIDKAISLLASPQHCRIFFVKLDNPLWVAPLRDRGCFRSPPRPVREGDSVLHPAWPPSHYLAKMAASVPDEVFRALEPVKTDNARVISDIVDAAISLPGRLAAKLAQKIMGAIKEQIWVDLYADRTSRLVATLAEEDELNAAMKLADVLFRIQPKKSIGYEPVSFIQAHRYSQLLPRTVAALGTADHERAMAWTCGLLRTAANWHVDPESRMEFDDLSYIWRPAIEDPPQHSGHDVTDSIVTAVRDLAEYAVGERLWPLEQTVLFLDSHRKLVLSRIGLHLVARFAESDPKLAKGRMLSKELFDSQQYRHEYASLLRDRFSILPPEEQAVVMGWIEQGPDREQTRKLLKSNFPGSFSEELVTRRVKLWQRDRLSWFRESLPREWHERYGQLVAEFGEPQHADFSSWIETGWGPGRLPKTAAELGVMETPDLVAYLRAWRPDPEEPMGASVRDMADQFAAAARDDLERFAAEAPAFAELHPTYVTALLHELGTAAKNKMPFPFEPPLDLCLAVVRKPVELAPADRLEGSDMDADPSWAYAQHAVADLVREMCDHGAPLSQRDKIWRCLAPLQDTPDESSLLTDPGTDLRTSSWLDRACNNPRAEFIHAVISYAIWVKKQKVKTSELPDGGLHGMDEAPEAGKMLEGHLQPECPDSSDVRSVYGTHFPALCWLDARWAKTHAGVIFTMEGDRAAHGWAAWNSYLVANRLYDQCFHMLRECYAFVVEQLEPTLTGEESRFNPLQSFAEHMVLACGRGLAAIEEEAGLLRLFFRRASAAVRAHAIEFVGRTLAGTDPLPEEVVPRFQALWAWYWGEFKQDRPVAQPEQFVNFGWWFTCGRFDTSWCLRQMAEVAQMAPLFQPDTTVMKKLAEVAESDPSCVVQLAAQMVEADKLGWHVSSWADELKAILTVAMRTAEAKATEQARALIDRLGRRGYLEYGRLLQG